MQPHQPLDERMGLIEVDFGYESVVIRAKEWIHGKYNRTYKERRDGNISFAGWSSSMNRHHVDITMPISAARGVHKIKVELGVEPQNIYAGRDFAFFSCIRIR